jgi:hypothetical protein
MSDSGSEDILKIVAESTGKEEPEEKPKEEPKVPQKVYRCKRCGREFASRSEYNRHIWEHTKAERAAEAEAESEEGEAEETTVIQLSAEGKPVRKIGAWDRLKWFIIGGLALLILYMMFLWWRKRGRKEGDRKEGGES